MRPKKIRWIRCEPGERCFRPARKPKRTRAEVNLTLDEFETLRLCDLEQLGQSVAAKRMKVHRSTVSRILTSARRKTIDALVNIKTLRIAGGCCKVSTSRRGSVMRQPP